MSEELSIGSNGGTKEPEVDTPKRVSDEDRLKAENLQLKVMNLSLQEQHLINDLGDLRARKTDLQNQLLRYREHVGEKYGVDFSKFDIKADDGTIVPRDSTPPGLIR